MTIEVELPDGSIAEFPDGMSPDEITRILRQHLAQPTPILSREREGALSQISPQTALDFVGQGAGALGGAALGAAPSFGVPAPFTVPAGAAAGSVAGKQAARALGGALGLEGSEAPDLASAETLLDAAAGAAGPIAGSTLRGVGRAVTGLERKGIRAVERQFDSNLRKMRQALRQPKRPSTSRVRVSEIKEHHLDALKEAKQAELAKAINLALTRATERGAAETALPGGILGTLVHTAEPIVGGLIGAGISHTAIRHAVPALLDSKAGPAIARWALSANKRRPPDAIKSLFAISIESGLTGEALSAVNALATELMKQGGQRQSAAPPRDKSGKFTKTKQGAKGGIDHTGLEQLFGDRFS